LAALSYAGDRLLTADRPQRLCLRDSKGDIAEQINLDAPVAAIALSALADYAVVGMANGAILRFNEPSAEGGEDLLK
jgi:hypothetical protein